ncbi:universal stress protein [Amycolatopsis alkalitolerans]|uniref:Universal stress protein n=1 Tax=Amycolatopsis alkalitolerans TaxID=2547244 RepID=A0A5C4M7W6_9PSEU|nr:universal stress protein [Amycolatopsis alkalitolerans]TNC29075.1 universal stress protein [Amycolatopsis alkalitolerans]
MAQAAAGGPIVVGVDGSGAAMRAVRWAAEAAVRRSAPVRIVHAVAPVTVRAPGAARVAVHARDAAKRLVEQVAAEAAMAAPGLVVTTVVPMRPAFEALLAESGTASMLVVGPTGLGALPGVLAGSLPAKLAAHSGCPVAVVRGSGERRRGPVVAGLDGGPLSEAVIAAAFEEAANREVPLIAVHAWSDADFAGLLPESRRYLGWEPIEEAERRVLGESLVPWQEKYPEVALNRLAVRDRPRHVLLEWSRRAQLLVIGHRGRGGFDGLALGSVGHALVHHAQSPVLVIRPPAR